MYGSETWTMRKEKISRIDAFQLWCYRRMLKVSHIDHITNKKSERNIKVENIKCFEDMAKRKMRFAEYIMRGSSRGLI